jgi:predicted nucleic acid-binding protein
MRKSEEKETKWFINQCGRFLIDKEACNKFIELQLGYRNDRIDIADCFIAAIAICNNIELYTLNTQDFNYIKGVKLYKPTHPKTD